MWLNIKYTTIHAIQKYGPVAQPGRVPDFYHIGISEEIRLSRVRIPTGPSTTRVHILVKRIQSSQNGRRNKMTVKLSTTLDNIERYVLNEENKDVIQRFFNFMKRIGTSERYQNNNLKALISYSRFLGPSISLNEVKNKIQITSFLDSKTKPIEEDPDKRWITTWNDYLGRIKYFYRWMYNYDDERFDDVQFSDWETPEFVRIKKKISRRISPYLENEL
jgi:hypothetical protein